MEDDSSSVYESPPRELVERVEAERCRLEMERIKKKHLRMNARRKKLLKRPKSRPIKELFYERRKHMPRKEVGRVKRVEVVEISDGESEEVQVEASASGAEVGGDNVEVMKDEKAFKPSVVQVSEYVRSHFSYFDSTDRFTGRVNAASRVEPDVRFHVRLETRSAWRVRGGRRNVPPRGLLTGWLQPGSWPRLRS